MLRDLKRLFRSRHRVFLSPGTQLFCRFVIAETMCGSGGNVGVYRIAMQVRRNVKLVLGHGVFHL